MCSYLNIDEADDNRNLTHVIDVMLVIRSRHSDRSRLLRANTVSYRSASYQRVTLPTGSTSTLAVAASWLRPSHTMTRMPRRSLASRRCSTVAARSTPRRSRPTSAQSPRSLHRSCSTHRPPLPLARLLEYLKDRLPSTRISPLPRFKLSATYREPSQSLQTLTLSRVSPRYRAVPSRVLPDPLALTRLW